MGCSFSGLNALYDAVNGGGDVWINENRFRIVRQLGEGGFAYVFLVKEVLSDSAAASGGGIAKKFKDSSHISVSEFQFVGALSVSVVQTLSVSNFDSSNIAALNGDNYADWKEKVLLALGCMDLDLALRVDEPPKPTKLSTQAEKTSYDLWEQSNCLSLMFIRSHIGKSIRGSIPDCAKAKEYLKAILDRFETSDKALASTLMTKTCSMKFNGTKSVCDHIMQMRDIAD